MEQQTSPPFIFYLCFEDSLPKTFYLFDRLLKEHGYVLVPIKIDQLQILAAASGQDQLIVMTCVTHAGEYRAYNEKVRGLLKFVLKSKRTTFLHLSSFSRLNDIRYFSIQKNYFFFKFPLNAQTLTEKIVRFHHIKQEQRTQWPGGRRSTLSPVI